VSLQLFGLAAVVQAVDTATSFSIEQIAHSRLQSQYDMTSLDSATYIQKAIPKGKPEPSSLVKQTIHTILQPSIAFT
jgi:hypothetical protein